CGFANANGGKLFIGIDDNGNVAGIDNYRELLEQLPNKFRDILGVFAEVNLQSKGNKYFLEIIVPRYDVPISMRGKYYVRTGSTLQELKGPALNEFILKRTGKTWDDIPEQRATISDIDETAISQFLKDASKAKRIIVENDISIHNLLEKLRLIEDGKLKRSAIVLFGKDPGKFYPNTAVKIGKFGESDADLKFHEVIEGNLIQMKERIEEMLNAKFFIHPIDFEGMQRVERDEYPVAAVREMILNALVHRNYIGAQTQIRLYDDHFSVWNDGGLPDGITEEDLKKIHRSKPRSPLIADVCFKGGYIDSWGRGTIKIIESCQEAGLLEPVLKEEQGGFLSKIFKDWLTKDGLKKLELTERQIEAVLYTKKYGDITNSKYQEIANVSKATASRDIKVLEEKGLLKNIGTKGSSAIYKIKVGSVGL
ncbi:MAG: putative DNA binding domain-containing protein, partial [Deltaproteobacteria bacterium]|nr:putative DNA binding domain-containing protein [Deltaproteobacteria bacterium]